MWPLVLPNGWRIHAMRPDKRSVHVRKHLLNPSERWEDLCSLSRAEIRRLRAQVEAAGLPCGPDATSTDDPQSAGHAIVHDLYVRDYLPVASIALLDALALRWAMAWGDSGGRTLAVVTDEGLVVVANGPEELRWRTAYRVRLDHRPTARPERVRDRYRRALKLAKTLAETGGKKT